MVIFKFLSTLLEDLNFNMKKVLITLLCMTGSLYAIRAQSVSPYILIDQFGYRPDAIKVAVIKNPVTGYDDTGSFNPGPTYHVMNAAADTSVYSGSPSVWNGGATDASSGDQAWWFDFSEVQEPGSYYLWDEQNDVITYDFDIDEDIYADVLKHAVRTFYYQRANHAKETPYAEAGWTDAIDHVGSLQDSECRVYDDPTNAGTEKDLTGGWYDAGDLNKYTPWTANYVFKMLLSYQENPNGFGDDYNIPESGNGIPDILDEAKWGMDHLLRMVQNDGSVLSIVSLDGASPPSAATGQSLYGDPNTHSANTTAAALAKGAKVYGDIGMTSYATTLQTQAELVWDWSDANPNVEWRNNDAAYGSQGIGAGQQETNNYGRLVTKIRAAIALYDLTGDSEYKTYVENNYDQVNMLQWNYAFPYQSENQDMLLYYANLPGVSSAVASDIISAYEGSMEGSGLNFPSYFGQDDPYRAYLDSYTWGSNNTKSRKGGMFYNYVTHNLNATRQDTAARAAEEYIHYIHGVNPLGMVYLSNMYNYGAENCVNEFYHTWYSDGSADWDRVGTSTYGPAPGFLVGGPNPSYDYDGCCPSGCGSTANNDKCTSEWIPTGQPDQKSYKDFNTSWPLNSWEITENSCGYQISYIQLLSKFVHLDTDCNGVVGGSAFIDSCGECAGGNTGITPNTTGSGCVTGLEESEELGILVYPNPSTSRIYIENKYNVSVNVKITDTKGVSFYQGLVTDRTQISIDTWPQGIYYVVATGQKPTVVRKVLKINAP